MDTRSTVIGLVIALICFAPFVIFSIIKRRNKNTLINSLNTLAQKQNSQIGSFEILNNAIIGIDTNFEFAYFIKNNDDVVVDLKNVNHCYLDIIKDSRQKALLNANIIFDTFSGKKITFNIFDDEVDPPLNGEIPFSEKWVNTFNQKIKLTAA
ncbi:hypothetical protein PW52_03145 [Tamlana sedimentorum]|uniref:Uncharacterized protein n=1 Tax=Neotamlana sedimentorum TaxID=1435349 RepID=A0A0D7WBU9_9FLAO|nr:hypothetical protein [Tamlana sedimentorum]KJD36655.1 hypothetical protein PW52_03145 [Tamlana sedimentorum]